jgi:hypothetical protein
MGAQWKLRFISQQATRCKALSTWIKSQPRILGLIWPKGREMSPGALEERVIWRQR